MNDPVFDQALSRYNSLLAKGCDPEDAAEVAAQEAGYPKDLALDLLTWKG